MGEKVMHEFIKQHKLEGWSYFRQNKIKKALKCFIKTFMKDPDNADALFGMGSCYMALRQPKTAAGAYLMAVKVNPEFAEAHYELGLMYCILGYHEKALLSCKRAIRLKPEFADVYETLEMALVEKLSRNPNDAEVHYNLGLLNHEMERYEVAIGCFIRSIELRPFYQEALCRMGRAYGYLGQHNEAKEYLKIAISIDSEYAYAHYLLGLTYSKLNDQDSAEEEYKTLQDIDKNLANELSKFIHK